jgi:hypothetical protein
VCAAQGGVQGAAHRAARKKEQHVDVDGDAGVDASANGESTDNKDRVVVEEAPAPEAPVDKPVGEPVTASTADTKAPAAGNSEDTDDYADEATECAPPGFGM